MIATAAAAFVLLLIAGVMMDRHVQDWRGALAGQEPGQGRLRFERSRYRRRMFTGGLIATTGSLIALWPIVPRLPWWIASYVAALALLTFLLIGLAAVDAWASAVQYRQRQHAMALERSELAQRLKQERLADQD
jgi:hypothetical protein